MRLPGGIPAERDEKRCGRGRHGQPRRRHGHAAHPLQPLQIPRLIHVSALSGFADAVAESAHESATLGSTLATAEKHDRAWTVTLAVLLPTQSWSAAAAPAAVRSSQAPRRNPSDPRSRCKGSSRDATAVRKRWNAITARGCRSPLERLGGYRAAIGDREGAIPLGGDLDPLAIGRYLRVGDELVGGILSAGGNGPVQLIQGLQTGR